MRSNFRINGSFLKATVKTCPVDFYNSKQTNLNLSKMEKTIFSDNSLWIVLPWQSSEPEDEMRMFSGGAHIVIVLVEIVT